MTVATLYVCPACGFDCRDRGGWGAVVHTELDFDGTPLLIETIQCGGARCTHEWRERWRYVAQQAVTRDRAH